MKLSHLCFCLVAVVSSAESGNSNSGSIALEEDYDPYLRFLEQSMSMSSTVENEEGEGPRVYPTNLPDNYKISAMFTTSMEDTNFAYTFAVAGNDASIISHATGRDEGEDDLDTVLYFAMDRISCDPNADVPTSFMTAKFNVYDFYDNDFIKQKTVCWKAPTGYYIGNNSGNPAVFRLMFQHYAYENLGSPDWEFDGTIATTQGKADVWKMGQSTLTLSRSTGRAIKYTTRYQPGRFDTEAELEFFDYEEYENPEDVPFTRLSDVDKEACQVLSTPGNYIVCDELEDSDDLKQAAKSAFEEQMSIEQNGYLPTTKVFNFPSSESDYEMLGTVEEQAKINDLKSFVPGMVARALLPVRGQGICGSCYAMGTTHSLTSAYNQANELGSNYIEFSIQHIMNCLPLQPVFLNISGEIKANPEGIYQDGNTGCWGGNPTMVIDFLLGSGVGASLPLREVEPYLGISSHCNLESDTVATSKLLILPTFTLICHFKVRVITELKLR